MATDLTGLQVRNTYNSLLKIGDNSNLTGTAKRISDGLGNDSPLFISTSQISIGVAPATGYDLTVNSGIRTGFIDVLGAATAQSLQFTGGGGTQGTMSWNTDEETVDLIQNGATLQLGQETHVHVKNQSGATINDGTPVYVTGTLGASGRLTVAPMIADGSIEAKYFLGVTTEDIPNGEDGKVTTFGKIRGLDTTAYTEGQTLYVSSTTAGFWQTTPPAAPALDLEVAIVINVSANNGTLFVRAQNGYYLGMLHDVYLNSVADNQLLVYNATNSRWENQGIASIGAINLDTVTDNGNTTTNNISVGDINAGNVTLTGYLRGAANFVIDPAAHGDETGVVQILGDLRVDGTTTTINSTTVTINDKNIVLAQGSALPGDANGAGITIDGADATMTYNSTSDRFVFNKDIEADLIGSADQVDGLDATDFTLNYITGNGATSGNTISITGGAGFNVFNATNLNRRLTINQNSGEFPRIYNYDTVGATFHEIKIGGGNNETSGILIGSGLTPLVTVFDGLNIDNGSLQIGGSDVINSSRGLDVTSATVKGLLNLTTAGAELQVGGVQVIDASRNITANSLNTDSISGGTIDINGTTAINLQYNGSTQIRIDSFGVAYLGTVTFANDGISLTDEDSTIDSFFHANVNYDAGLYTVTSNARYGSDYIQIDGLDSREYTRFTISPKDIGSPDPHAYLYIGGDNSITAPNTLVNWHTIEMNALSVQINNDEVATQPWSNNAFVNITGDTMTGLLILEDGLTSQEESVFGKDINSTTTLGLTNSNIYVYDTSTTITQGMGGGITFSSVYISDGTRLGKAPYIRASKKNSNESDYGFGLNFGVRASGSANNNVAMVIDSDSNVSISDGDLSVNGNQYVQSQFGQGVSIANKIFNYGSEFRSSGASIQIVFGRDFNNIGSGGIGADESNCFAVWNTDTVEKKMLITQGGKMGIAQTSPQGDIHIGTNDGNRKLILHGANSDNNSSEIIFGDNNIFADNYSGIGIRYNSALNNLSIRSFFDETTSTGRDVPIVTFARQSLNTSFASSVTATEFIADLINGFTYQDNSFLNFHDDNGVDDVLNTTTLGSIGHLNFIIDTNNNGDIDRFHWLKGDSLPNSSTRLMSLDLSGNLDLDSGSLKLANAVAIDSSRNVYVPDSSSVYVGDGNDLSIYHNGTNTLMDNATGSFFIRTLADDQDIVLATDNGSGSVTDYLRADGSLGSVKLFHYGNQKLVTTASGVQITGTLSGDISTTSISGATIDINATTRLNLQYDGTTKAYVDSSGFNIVDAELDLSGVAGISLQDESSAIDSYFHANVNYDAGLYQVLSNTRYGSDYIQVDGNDTRGNTVFVISPKDLTTSNPDLFLGGDNAVTSPNTLTDWRNIKMNATSVQINGNEVATQSWVNTNTLNQTEGDNRYLQLSGGTLTGELNVTGTKITFGSADYIEGDYTNYQSGLFISSGQDVAIRINGNDAGNDVFYILNGTAETQLFKLEGSTGATTISGNVTATSFIKSGGTSSQFLKADGSVDSSTYLTAEADTLSTVTARGAATSNSIETGGLVSFGAVELNVMPGFQQEGTITIGRTDGTSRYHEINAYNDNVGSNNYLRFRIHNGAVDGLNTALTLKGDGDAIFTSDVYANVSEILATQTWVNTNFYDTTEADSRYVNIAGDTMTGDLSLGTNNFTSGTATIGGILLQDSADRGGVLEINRKGTNSWTGTQIKHDTALWSVMGNATNFGIYDDVNNDWILLHDTLDVTKFFYQASEKLRIDDSGVTVTGRLYSSQYITVGNNSNGASYIYLLSSTTGLSQLRMGDTDTDAGAISYNNASDLMTFRVNAANRVYIDSDGDLGVNVSNPSSKLHVAGDAYITNELSVGVANADKVLSYGTELRASGASIQLVFGRNDNAIGSGAIGADSTNSFVAWNTTTFAKQLVVSQAGDVSIGADTPTQKLHVEGTGYFNPSANSALILGRVGGTPSIRANTDDGGYLIMDSNGGMAALNWYSANNVVLGLGGGSVGVGRSDPSFRMDVSGNFRALASLSGWAGWIENTATGGANSGLVVTAGDDSGDSTLLLRQRNGSEIFKVRGDSRVGINSSSPLGQLDVRQAQQSTPFTTPFLKLYPTSTTNETGHTAITLGTSPVDNYGVSLSGWRYGTDGTPKFRIKMHTNSATGIDALIVDHLGKVGIKNSSPDRTLSVAGNGKFTSDGSTLLLGSGDFADTYLTFRNSSAGVDFGLQGNTNLFSNGTILIKTGTAKAFAIVTNNSGSFSSVTTPAFFIDTAGEVGIGGTKTPAYALDVTGTIRATGDVIAYSDARVKENVNTIDNALEKVTQLRGVSYNKIGETEEKIGVIAQEIEKVLPQVVQEDKNGMKSVAYGNIVGVLIEAIKEQQKQIDELKSIINGGS